MKVYNREQNYIGNSEFQYKITNFIYRKISGINYSAYWHDILYKKILWQEKGIINKFILKLLLDLLFLIIGFFRCLFKAQIHGCAYIILVYIILVLDTPRYLWNINKTN